MLVMHKIFKCAIYVSSIYHRFMPLQKKAILPRNIMPILIRCGIKGTFTRAWMVDMETPFSHRLRMNDQRKANKVAICMEMLGIECLRK